MASELKNYFNSLASAKDFYLQKSEPIKKKKTSAKTTIILDIVWKENNLPVPTKEYKFLGDRNFRIDFAFVNIKLAIEIEGGVWANGRHTRGSGFIKDMEKYNLLTENGWRLLRYTPQTINYTQILKLYRILSGIYAQKE